MSYCLNLHCPKPQNPRDHKFCSTCGARLLLGDRYRALQVISQGGIGRTFLAIDEHDTSKRRCIIKQFSPQNQGTNTIEKAAELFGQEAARLQALGQHPQIPQLLAYFAPENQVNPGQVAFRGSTPALVQSFIEGESLAQQLNQEGAFNETQVQHILKELLPVLQFVHDRGVIHRDINPENIICCSSNNQLILVDFSAAKVTTKTALAKTGTVIGSAAYTAPEQLMGKAEKSSDLYSLGVTCVQLLTNIHPFDLFNSLEGVWVWQDYLTTPVTKPLIQILNKMLAGAIKHRYQSAQDVLQDLNPHSTLISSIKWVKPTASPAVTPQSLCPTWNCKRSLTGHLSSIHALAFSPHSQTLASGSADRTVKIWNVDKALPSFSLTTHSNLINAVAWSADGRMLASGSWDHTIKIWNLATGELDDLFLEPIHEFKEHSGWILSLAISPDGSILASGSADKCIKLWDLTSASVRATFCEHKGGVGALAISPDGKIIASGSSDKTIKLWTLETGEVWHTLEGHSDTVHSLTFSPSGQLLISSSADKTIKLWNLNSGQILHTLSGHSAAVNSVAINGAGTMLISGSADQTIKIWHPGSGELLHTLTGHSAGVTCMAISPDGRTLASGSQDKTIKLWRFE